MTNYRITKKTDGPTGRVTYTPEYYGYKNLWPFRRWCDFSYSRYNPVILGHMTYYIQFETYEEAVEWLRKREEDIAKSKIPTVTTVFPVDLS